MCRGTQTATPVAGPEGYLAVVVKSLDSHASGGRITGRATLAFIRPS
jgi:hypothetical protein